MTTAHCPLPVEYVIPLRWADDRNLPELTDYLRDLHTWVDVTVVDGSDAELFAAHAAAWPMVRHLPVDDWPGRNRKVAGVVTGVRAARHECVVIADDDVRYRPEQLAEILSRLAGADLVRPQNVFQPLPWHARWDTARALLNRAFGSDYPGTFGVRKSAFDKVGGYDERFAWWGADDHSFGITMQAMWGEPVWLPGVAYHLWHPPQEDTAHGHPQVKKGHALYARYKRAQGDEEAVRAVRWP